MKKEITNYAKLIITLLLILIMWNGVWLIAGYYSKQQSKKMEQMIDTKYEEAMNNIYYDLLKEVK